MEASRARQTVSQPVSIWRPRIILNLVPIVVRHFYRSPTGQTDIPKLMFVIRERQFTIGSYLIRTDLFRGVDKPRCGSGAVIWHHHIELMQLFSGQIEYVQIAPLLKYDPVISNARPIHIVISKFGDLANGFGS